MVGSDHFHQLWLDNMPQFLVGKAPFYDANYYNEEREFGLPRMLLRGQEDLSAHLLRGGLDAGFDLAFSNELRIDHSITCPIITLRPQNDLPIVPVYTNIFAPPMPQPKRFVQLGRAIRRVVESWPSDLRVAIIGTGHLSLELGGPRQFGPHGPDPEFDRRAVEWIARGDIEGCLAEVTLDSLHLPGNATHGFMDFMLMMGVAGEGAGRLRRHPRPVPHHGGLLHLVPERSAGMSKYLLNKFLFTVDRDPELVERYRADPAAWCLVGGGAGQHDPQLHRRRERTHLAALHRGGAGGAAPPRPLRAVRDGRPPVPHPHAVHRAVRARPRAAGVPDGVWRRADPLHAAVPGHRHLRTRGAPS